MSSPPGKSGSAPRLEPKPLPENIGSVQPGSGYCYQIELAWGRVRRWYLKQFRSGYVERMAKCRQGDLTGAPHEVLDPRDLKFCRNLCQAYWKPEDDPFQWRERIPFARWGLAELLLMGLPLLALTILLGMYYWPLALIAAVPLALVVYFFRDPSRKVPQEPGLVVSPADGKVVDITELAYAEFIEGPAVRIGIFLSLFNVHINRSPLEAKVIELRYSPGQFINAMNPDSSLVNENLWIALEEEAAPHRRMTVRQISGLVARRIVCEIRPGEVLPRGHKFGMIKLGSRTELIVPHTDDLKIETEVGQHVRAGSDILCRFSQ